jgi:hypothetical protein
LQKQASMLVQKFLFTLGLDRDRAVTKPFDGGQDIVGGFGPAEGLGVGIAGVDVGGDSGLQRGSRAVGAALDLLVGEQGKEALDLVDPRRGCRREVHLPAEPFGKPVADQFGLMARRVVDDDVDVEIGGYLLLDGIQEAAEFLRPMARHACVDDGSGLHVEGGKERGRPVPLIVMSAPFGLPWSHGQQRRGAIQRLDLRFLIDAQHQPVVRRVEIEADDIAHRVNEEGIGRQLEGFAAVRLQRKRPPDAMYGRDRQRARTPVSGGSRHRLQCRRHHFGTKG